MHVHKREKSRNEVVGLYLIALKPDQESTDSSNATQLGA